MTRTPARAIGIAATRPHRQLDHRAAARERPVDVEADVLRNRPAPRVVERRDPVVLGHDGFLATQTNSRLSSSNGRRSNQPYSASVWSPETSRRPSHSLRVTHKRDAAARVEDDFDSVVTREVTIPIGDPADRVELAVELHGDLVVEHERVPGEAAAWGEARGDAFEHASSVGPGREVEQRPVGADDERRRLGEREVAHVPLVELEARRPPQPRARAPAAASPGTSRLRSPSGRSPSRSGSRPVRCRRRARRPARPPRPPARRRRRRPPSCRRPMRRRSGRTRRSRSRRRFKSTTGGHRFHGWAGRVAGRAGGLHRGGRARRQERRRRGSATASSTPSGGRAHARGRSPRRVDARAAARAPRGRALAGLSSTAR